MNRDYYRDLPEEYIWTSLKVCWGCYRGPFLHTPLTNSKALEDNSANSFFFLGMQEL